MMNVSFADGISIVLISVGFTLWAASKFANYKAKANPENDWWDEAAPRITWAAERYAEAIDWLVSSKHVTWRGDEKLKKLNELLTTFEKQWDAGNRKEAIAALIGYWMDAKNKAEASKQMIPPS